jgi:hypothetical protein
VHQTLHVAVICIIEVFGSDIGQAIDLPASKCIMCLLLVASGGVDDSSSSALRRVGKPTEK